ncbi:Uma2 family endonuclease [Streptomyces sp. NPDC058848]|uniref:Uma2 family endonuclease n=1 Tax=unclassified Streptomyces TaxID=2593676 RepID=UPI0036846078
MSSGPFRYVFPGVERAYGPDIHVSRRSVSRSTSSHMDGEALAFVFVAELTSSSTRDDDLTDKVETYGRPDVPVHLLLDMQEEQATDLWTPSAKGYESRITRPFGEKPPIPAPLDCLLVTAGFQAP